MKNLKRFSMITILLISLLNFMIIQTIYANNNDISINTISTKGINLETQKYWHNGSNIVISDLSLEYWLDANVVQGEDVLYENMFITYKDMTYTRVGLQITVTFDKGGLDVARKTVLNWSKAKSSAICMISDSTYPNYKRIEFSFNGFDIVNGTAKDLKIEKNSNEESWNHNVKNIISSIQFRNTNYYINNVELNTIDYLYNNQVLKKSIFDFNVTLNSTIGTETQKNYIPVILKFRITHNITSTIFKYGMDIDWSKCKAFPTTIPLSTGDDFTLLSNDLITVSNGNWQIGHFTTDPENRTAIFTKNGNELGREYFTTQYQIKGSPTTYNTTRIYIQNESDPGGIYEPPYVSKVFVCFDGFKYNQSTGLIFDPIIVIPCSSSIGLFYLIIFIIILAGISAVPVIFIMKRRSKPKTAS
ncbi:MAG: hypothetical protein ACTSQO_15075 [Candidatus Helarchaeota archaeon]